MKRLLCFILFVMLAAPAFDVAQAEDLTGSYSITQAVDPYDNANYKGRVGVDCRKGFMCYVAWKIDGASPYRGLGFLNNGIFSVAWSSSSEYGLAVYKVNGGRLSGQWFTDSTERLPGIEELEGPPGLNGTYQIKNGHGSDNGDRYSGTVEIRKNGEVYDLTWDVDGYVYKGVGILKGNVLTAGWGKTVGAAYYEVKGDQLFGRCAYLDQPKAGVENLARVKPPQTILAYGINTASSITFEELSKRIEKTTASIHSMTYDYVLRTMSRNGDAAGAYDLIRAKNWRKYPGLAKDDSVYLYLPDKPERHVYISKLEGANYNAYEFLNDGSVKKTSYPIEEWEKSDFTPRFFYNKIKQKIKDGIPYTLEYNQDRNVYVLKFDTPDKASFEISGESWLPYEASNFDSKYNAVVEALWSNIQINPKISDDVFRVPQ